MRLGDHDHHVPLSIAVIAGCSWKCLTVTGLLAHATPAGEALPLPAFIRCRPTQNALVNFYSDTQNCGGASASFPLLFVSL